MKTPVSKPIAFILTALTLAGTHADNPCTGVRHLKADCLRQAPEHATSMSVGEVKAIDTAGNKLTMQLISVSPGAPFQTGSIVTLPVQKPAMLATTRKGDKVKFTVEKIGDKTTITELQPEG
jgi:Cu/Ag efflux protein CusF